MSDTILVGDLGAADFGTDFSRGGTVQADQPGPVYTFIYNLLPTLTVMRPSVLAQTQSVDGVPASISLPRLVAGVPAPIQSALTLFIASVNAAAPLNTASSLTIGALQKAGFELLAQIDSALTDAAGYLDIGDLSGFPGDLVNGLLGLAISSQNQSVLADMRGLVGRALFNLSQAARSPAAPPRLTSPPSVVPINISAPVILGSASVGSTLSTDGGSWTGTFPQQTSYDWTSGGVSVSGAPTYTITSGDIGQAIFVTVTRTNIVGSASARCASPTIATS